MINAKNLVVRAISGIIFAIIMIGAMSFSQYSFLALVAVIVCGSMLEFFKLVPDSKPLRFYSIVIGLSVLFIGFFVASGAIESSWLSVIFALISLLFVAELYRKRENPIRDIAYSLCAVCYIAVPMTLLVDMGLSHNEGITTYDYHIVLGYVILIWTNDVGAYLVGSLIGKRKLFEKISPKKSWEGFFGGVILTMLCGGLMGYYSGISVVLCIAIGAVIALAGVAGDLVESMFKRSAGVKDSGKLMPGHGGFLDRFDAMFISLPFVYLLLELLS